MQRPRLLVRAPEPQPRRAARQKGRRCTVESQSRGDYSGTIRYDSKRFICWVDAVEDRSRKRALSSLRDRDPGGCVPDGLLRGRGTGVARPLSDQLSRRTVIGFGRSALSRVGPRNPDRVHTRAERLRSRSRGASGRHHRRWSRFCGSPPLRRRLCNADVRAGPAAPPVAGGCPASHCSVVVVRSRPRSAPAVIQRHSLRQLNELPALGVSAPSAFRRRVVLREDVC
jgi:hypothetical protein